MSEPARRLIYLGRSWPEERGDVLTLVWEERPGEGSSEWARTEEQVVFFRRKDFLAAEDGLGDCVSEADVDALLALTPKHIRNYGRLKAEAKALGVGPEA